MTTDDLEIPEMGEDWFKKAKLVLPKIRTTAMTGKMSFAEFRVIEHLVREAQSIKRIEPGWASDNLAAFELIMRKERPRGKEFEVTDQQFERCIRQAFVELNQVKND